MVVYGILTRADIGELFVAGIVPGILAIGLYLVAIEWTVRRNPALAPAGSRSTWLQRRAALRPVWPVALLFLVVIGGLYAKAFTPTEGAGVGAQPGDTGQGLLRAGQGAVAVLGRRQLVGADQPQVAVGDPERRAEVMDQQRKHAFRVTHVSAVDGGHERDGPARGRILG